MANETSRVTFFLPITGETPITDGTVTFENVDDITSDTTVIWKVGAVEESKPLGEFAPAEEAQLERIFARLGFDYDAFLNVHERGEGFLLSEIAEHLGNETAESTEGKKRLERILYGKNEEKGKGEPKSLARMAATYRSAPALEALKALSRVKPSEQARAIRHLAEAAAYSEEITDLAGRPFKSFRNFTDPLMSSACSFLEGEIFRVPMSVYETAMKALSLVCPADTVYETVTDRLPRSCEKGELSNAVPNTARPYYPEEDRGTGPSPARPEPAVKPEPADVTLSRNLVECAKPWLRRIAARSLGGSLARPDESGYVVFRDMSESERDELMPLAKADRDARDLTTTHLLKTLLKDPDSTVRMAAAYALSQADWDIFERTDRQDPYSSRAVQRLSETVDELWKRLKDLPGKIRARVAQKDGVPRQVTQNPFNSKGYPTIADMEAEKDPHHLAVLVQRFGEGLLMTNAKGDIPVIVAYLNHPSTVVSLAAGHVLAHLPDDFWNGYASQHPDGMAAIEKAVKAIGDFAWNCRRVVERMHPEDI